MKLTRTAYGLKSTTGFADIEIFKMSDLPKGAGLAVSDIPDYTIKVRNAAGDKNRTWIGFRIKGLSGHGLTPEQVRGRLVAQLQTLLSTMDRNYRWPMDRDEVAERVYKCMVPMGRSAIYAENTLGELVILYIGNGVTLRAGHSLQDEWVNRGGYRGLLNIMGDTYPAMVYHPGLDVAAYVEGGPIGEAVNAHLKRAFPGLARAGAHFRVDEATARVTNKFRDVRKGPKQSEEEQE